MIKKYILSGLLGLGALLFISCDADNGDLQAEDLNAKMMGAFIYDSDLVGEWDLSAMVTDTLIDLNGDKVFTKNLIAETTCFDSMSMIFYGDKTFVSVNARLGFEGGDNDDEFVCMSTTTHRGKWSVDDDILSLHIMVDGKEETHKKQLIHEENLFSFEVNRLESQAYVTDPGNLSVSKVSVVSLEYVRKK